MTCGLALRTSHDQDAHLLADQGGQVGMVEDRTASGAVVMGRTGE
jgi:hypothetical protein